MGGGGDPKSRQGVSSRDSFALDPAGLRQRHEPLLLEKRRNPVGYSLCFLFLLVIFLFPFVLLLRSALVARRGP